MSAASYILILALLLIAAPAMTADPPSGDRKTDQQKQRDREPGKYREEAKKLTPQEREAKRKEIKARLEKRLDGLHAKEKKESLTDEEKRDLKRCEQILKRFEQSNATKQGGKGGKPQKPAEEKGRTCEHP